MNHQEKMEKLRVIFDKSLAIMDAKGRDYSGTEDAMSNFHDFGWKGIIVRLGDKWNRIKNLTKSGTAALKSEQIEDTLMDNIGYSALALVEKEWEDAQYTQAYATAPTVKFVKGSCV